MTHTNIRPACALARLLATCVTAAATPASDQADNSMPGFTSRAEHGLG